MEQTTLEYHILRQRDVIAFENVLSLSLEKGYILKWYRQKDCIYGVTFNRIKSMNISHFNDELEFYRIEFKY